MPRPKTRTEEPVLPKVVLFDLDDTIFDHSLTCRDAIREARGEFPELRGRPLEATWREYGRLLGVTHTDVMLGLRSSDEVRTERFLRLSKWSGRPVDRARAASISLSYRQHYQRLRRAIPGAPETIRRLKGRTQVGVVTNNTVAEQVEKLAFLGLDRSVDFMVTSEEIGAAKPDPKIFRAALARAGASPQEAVMVGDSWASDVRGARTVGIRPLWFNRFRAPPPERVAVREFSSFRSTGRFERLLVPP